MTHNVTCRTEGCPSTAENLQVHMGAWFTLAVDKNGEIIRGSFIEDDQGDIDDVYCDLCGYLTTPKHLTVTKT